MNEKEDFKAGKQELAKQVLKQFLYPDEEEKPEDADLVGVYCELVEFLEKIAGWNGKSPMGNKP